MSKLSIYTRLKKNEYRFSMFRFWILHCCWGNIQTRMYTRTNGNLYEVQGENYKATNFN